MTAIATATQSTTTTVRSQQLLFFVDGSDGGHHQRKQWSMVAMVMVVFVDNSCQQRRRHWDGVTMTQWHWRKWRLQPMAAVAVAIVLVNCTVAVDAAATIPSSVLTGAAKMPLPLPQSTTASINDDCYRRR
jgi:hypothetical protein